MDPDFLSGLLQLKNKEYKSVANIKLSIVLIKTLLVKE
jgi:hypothetical protein